MVEVQDLLVRVWHLLELSVEEVLVNKIEEVHPPVLLDKAERLEEVKGERYNKVGQQGYGLEVHYGLLSI